MVKRGTGQLSDGDRIAQSSGPGLAACSGRSKAASAKVDQISKIETTVHADGRTLDFGVPFKSMIELKSLHCAWKRASSKFVDRGDLPEITHLEEQAGNLPELGVEAGVLGD